MLKSVADFVSAVEAADSALSDPVNAWRVYVAGAMRVVGPYGKDLGHLPRKTRALIAYLCMAQPKKVTRSRLTTLLWDGPEEQARRNLRDALYRLDRLAGPKTPSLIRSEHEYLCIDNQCWIDVHQAPRGYSERLLDDLDGISSDFDHWLDGERSRFEDRIRNMLEAKLARAVETESIERQASVARELVNFDPTHEPAVCVLMRAFVTMGEPAQALREYQRCRDALRNAYDTSPAPETYALYEEIRQCSLRARIEIETPARLDMATATTDQRTPNQHREPSIAVLPFRNLSAQPGHDCAAECITEDLIGLLSRVHGFFVISRLSTISFRNQDRAPNDIGDALDVRYLLSGSIRIAGGRIYLSAELTDTLKGVVLWCDHFVEPLSRVIGVGADLAEEVVRRVAPQLRAAELRRTYAKRPEDLGAYELFLRAQEDMHNASVSVFNRAERFLTRALVRDPNYATALAWRAYWHVLRVGQGWSSDPAHDANVAADFARRARNCDPFEPMACAIQGHIASYLHKDFEAAFRSFETAVRTNPNAAPAWLFSGVARAWAGEGTRAVEEVSKALALSPFDPLLYATNSAASAAHLVTGQHERAVEFARRAIHANSTYTAAYRNLIIALVMAGRTQEARVSTQRLLRLEPHFTVERYRKSNPSALSRIGNSCCESLAMAGVPYHD